MGTHTAQSIKKQMYLVFEKEADENGD